MWLIYIFHLLWDSDIHIFAVSMKTAGAISLKIWNVTVWTTGLNAKQKNDTS